MKPTNVSKNTKEKLKHNSVYPCGKWNYVLIQFKNLCKTPLLFKFILLILVSIILVTSDICIYHNYIYSTPKYLCKLCSFENTELSKYIGQECVAIIAINTFEYIILPNKVQRVSIQFTSEKLDGTWVSNVDSINHTSQIYLNNDSVLRKSEVKQHVCYKCYSEIRGLTNLNMILFDIDTKTVIPINSEPTNIALKSFTVKLDRLIDDANNVVNIVIEKDDS